MRIIGLTGGIAAGKSTVSRRWAEHGAVVVDADRLARGLAVICNVLDPDVIVLGGGLSNMAHLYERVPALLRRYVFSDVVDTPILRNRHGDSSGVRGAAWLWPPGPGGE